MDTQKRELWDRLENEPERAYRAFEGFLSLPSGERTLLKAYRRQVGNPDAAKPSDTWSGWASTFAWRERAAAYEDHLASVRREAYERAVEEETVASSTSEASVDVSFNVSDRKDLRRRAMRAAVEDAQESARVLAEASGSTLGEILSVDYSFVEVRTRRFSYADRLRGRLMADPAPTPDVEPEALVAEEGVTLVWGIS